MHTLNLSKQTVVLHHGDWSGDIKIVKELPTWAETSTAEVELSRDELIDLCAAFILDTQTGTVVLGVVREKIEERLRDVFMNMPVK